MTTNDEPKSWESPYDRAARKGRESGESGGDWRDNPHTPGTREHYEFADAQADAAKERE
jgi:hypothetical protein